MSTIVWEDFPVETVAWESSYPLRLIVRSLACAGSSTSRMTWPWTAPAVYAYGVSWSNPIPRPVDATPHSEMRWRGKRHAVGSLAPRRPTEDPPTLLREGRRGRASRPKGF